MTAKAIGFGPARPSACSRSPCKKPLNSASTFQRICSCSLLSPPSPSLHRQTRLRNPSVISQRAEARNVETAGGSPDGEPPVYQGLLGRAQSVTKPHGVERLVV